MPHYESCRRACYLILLLLGTGHYSTLLAAPNPPASSASQQKASSPRLGEAEAKAIHELVRLHLEACGGVERLQQFVRLEARGQVSIGGRTLDTRIFGEAPNRVRTETSLGERRVVQGYDGSNPPWQALIEADKAPHCTLLAHEAAREFIRDAAFADPLLDPEGQGRRLRYLGHAQTEDGAVERLRLIEADDSERELWLSTTTHLITRQRSVRQLPGGKVARLETRFDDFKPVDGLLLPHRLRVYGEGKKLHETELHIIHINPELEAGLFSRDSFSAAAKADHTKFSDTHPGHGLPPQPHVEGSHPVHGIPESASPEETHPAHR